MGRESLSGSGGQIAHLPQDASCIPFQVQNNFFSCCRESDNIDNKGLFLKNPIICNSQITDLKIMYELEVKNNKVLLL